MDDNKDIVLTLSLLLEDDGCEVRTAYDGREALVVYAEFDPDALIADIGLPGASGWEVARAIRKIAEGERPVMIAISGEYIKGADRIMTEMSGFNYFLSKPFAPKVLVALLAPLKVAAQSSLPSN